MFKPAAAASVNALFAAVREALDYAHAEGVRHGSSLIQRLASGDITPGQFEERAGR